MMIVISPSDFKLIIAGKVCPYCHQKTELIDSEEVYGKSYGKMYICRGCDAYVGCHKGTEKALGRIASKQLRELKKKAHRLFDPLWKIKIERGMKKLQARGKGYKWLGELLNIAPRYAHIGMMDEDQLKIVIKECKKYYK